MRGFGVVTYRQGVSLARGTTIDAYLPDEANELLYKLWKTQRGWPEMLEFPGKVFAITCEMIQEVPSDEFIRAFQAKYGKKWGEMFALGILDVAASNSGR